jgi:integrase/recombinase XerD
MVTQHIPFQAALARFIEDCHARDRSPRTIACQSAYLRLFIRWCQGEGLRGPDQLDLGTLEHYRVYIHSLRHPVSGLPLSKGTRNNRLIAIRSFLHRLRRLGLIDQDVSRDLELDRDTRRLPGPVLTEEEVTRMLMLPDIRTPRGLRDRALLELLYASGIRCMEAVNLALRDADLDQGSLRVNAGKGNVDRLIPISPRACRWLHRYQEVARPHLVKDPACSALLVNDHGRRFSRQGLTQRVSRYRDRAGIDKPGSTHLFRRTTATRMIENGADICFVKEQLGHADISTTALYVRLTTRRLREEYLKTHPSALRRGEKDGE